MVQNNTEVLNVLDCTSIVITTINQRILEEVNVPGKVIIWIV